MEYTRKWVKARAAKQMARYEKKLKRAADNFFGHPVSIAYLERNALVTTVKTGEKGKVVTEEKNDGKKGND